MYNLLFLGGAAIEGPDGPVVGPAVQARRLAFLARLAIARGRPVARDKLIALLWPESAPESARHSVRETVYVLNRALENAPVEVVGDGLRIDPDRCPSDVAAFEAALESGDLEGAVEVYRGGFLAGLFLKDALEFEEWAREVRERLDRAYAQALEELAERATREGDALRAASWWRKRVSHDPYSGRATLRLMESLAAAGDRAEALRQADAHTVRMREAFDTDGDSAVKKLAAKLREESPQPVRTSELSATVRRNKSRRWSVVQSPSMPLGLAALVAGVALWYVTLRDAEPGPESASATVEARAVAILPFSVRGEGVTVLREGMVDLLSAGLDGAGGLRTISPTTLLVRWDEVASESDALDLSLALDVASQLDARYALVGSAVAIGSDVRLVADVYDVNARQRLGQARAEGSSDEVLGIVDRLAVDALRVILQRGEGSLPEINLASLTTASPEALQAFLEGEVHFRRFDMAPARRAYERAVEADSTFALAHYRLGFVHFWAPGSAASSPDVPDYHFTRAARYADRLPMREATYVRAVHAWTRKTLDWAEPLHEALERYPEDAHAWFLLGEMYLHATFTSAEEIDEQFARAAELDPGNATYLNHHVQFAWWHDADSARAARELERYERVAPDDVLGGGAGRLALDAAFGDSTAQNRAVERLRNEDLNVGWMVAWLLCHPRYPARERVLEQRLTRLRDSQKTWTASDLFRVHALWHGRLREGLAYLSYPAMSPAWRANIAYEAAMLGLPIPEETLASALDPTLVDSLPELQHVIAVGGYAADRRRWSDHARAIETAEAIARRSLEAADTMSGTSWQGVARALEGYGVLLRGDDPEAAVAILENPTVRYLPVGRLWLAQAYEDAGRLRDAVKVYRGYYLSQRSRIAIEPLVHLRLAGAYEELGETDEARRSYEYFRTHWDGADSELQPLVDRARQAILRLEGLRRG